MMNKMEQRAKKIPWRKIKTAVAKRPIFVSTDETYWFGEDMVSERIKSTRIAIPIKRENINRRIAVILRKSLFGVTKVSLFIEKHDFFLLKSYDFFSITFLLAQLT